MSQAQSQRRQRNRTRVYGILSMVGILSLFLIGSCQNDQEDPLLENSQDVFNDTFLGIDSGIWSTTQQSLDSGTDASGTTITETVTTHFMADNDSCLTRNNVTLNGERLRLSVQNQSVNCSDSSNVLSYTGGELRSVSTFQYGRFTANLQPSLADGVLTSIFLRNATEEIGLHFPGNDIDVVWISFRKGDESTITSLNLDFNVNQGFHTYELLWQEGLIQWSVDGTPVFGSKDDVPSEAMTLFLTNWVSGDEDQAGPVAENVSVFTEFESFQVETFSE